MTYATIMRAVSINCGITPITTTGSAEPDHVKLGQFINDAGAEIARRVDWGALRKTATLAGTGAATDHALVADFSRLSQGLCVVAGVNPVRGSLTADEWASLAPVEGTPRYFYLRGGTISLYPFLASGSEAKVHYLSSNWVDGNKAVMTDDGDKPLFSDDLIIANATARWRRHIGKDYSDHLAEFEAMLADRARFDGGVRSS